MLNTYHFPNMLLPANKTVDFSKKVDAVKMLNTLSAMYGFAAKALHTLKNGDLLAFDSLTTDCACHLRALKIASLSQNLFEINSVVMTDLTNKVEFLQKKQILLKNAAIDLNNWYQNGKKDIGILPPIIKTLFALQKKDQPSSFCFNLKNVLEHLEVKEEMSEEWGYAIQAYILTVVKGYKGIDESDGICCSNQKCKKVLSLKDGIFKEVTLRKQLSTLLKAEIDNLDIHTNLIQNTIYKLAKKNLAQQSVQFLLQEASKLNNTHLFNLLTLSQKTVEERIELPDFYSLTGTFQVCLQKKIPVLLKIKKCFHGHRYQEPKLPFDVIIYLFPQGENFEVRPIDQYLSNSSIIVVEGKRSGDDVIKESTENYQKRLMKDFDFLHFCAMDGAQHKQYTSDDDSMLQLPSEVIPPLKEDKFALEAKEVDALKKEAEEKGCSFYQQSLLIFTHIFADTLYRQLEPCSLSQKKDSNSLDNEEK